MARKRKQSIAAIAGPAKKQQVELEAVVSQKPKLEEYEYMALEGDDVEEEEEPEEEEEGSDYDDGNEDDDGGDDDEEEEEGGDDDQEPIQKLLEPFTKDQLVALILESSNRHRDVANHIRKMADEDPVHRKIFVHGLGWDTNTETLINAFKQYGEIEDCKAVCDKISGKSKGYGFILFKSRSGARNALKDPQKKIGNRVTACQLASIGPVPANQQVAAPTPPVSELTLRKIYVSNVGADLDPKKLTEFFSKYGEIEEGPLGLDKVTGKPKGFCLFVYKTVEGAKKSLEEPHKNFEGHILHCQKAIDGPKPGKSQHSRQQKNPQTSQFQSADSLGYGVGSMGQFGAPIGIVPGAVAAVPALNPALGQAVALLATQGAGLGIGNLLGSFGAASAGNLAMPAAGHGLQAAYGSQVNPGVVGSYGTQAAYPTQQQIGQGAPRGQHSGQYPGAGPYTGH
ncbi:hypothetical protein SAY87_000963 [Trapa incisa]|uniref:RRM domain-containing protein n=1 Tax=Trapa incisa TaxID=236973 RepID=A0AAN7GUL4_9MYRT|nr:hypothetical protein SAY87_000963 [Trapa incisa]